ncbi:MBL fold metallo-hydrolase [Spiroplasma endosymbiont of Crioceris asparagi]|uniref:MBL fold metallo-hydrolase n=1 Tax=Spiroplasma endosymbiont of Crioceris asparagi TaxID=3066286 RepID=UPI0030CB8B71
MIRIKKILLMLLLIIGIFPLVFATSCKKDPIVKADFSYHVLAVGNGNFTFLENNNTGHIVILDCGNGLKAKQTDDLESSPISNRKWGFERRTNVKKYFVDYLNHFHVTEIEAIFVSHNHADHFNEIENMLSNFKVDNLIMPIVYDSAKTQIETYVKKTQNESLNIDTTFSYKYSFMGIEFHNITAKLDHQALIDADYKASEGPNATSMVIDFTVNGQTVLFTGDAIEMTVSPKKFDPNGIFKSLISKMNINTFLLAHHGSTNSSTDKLLEYMGKNASSIKYSLISGTNHYSGNWWNASGNHSLASIQEVGYTKQCAKNTKIFITGTMTDDNSGTYDVTPDGENKSYEIEYKESGETLVIPNNSTVIHPEF